MPHRGRREGSGRKKTAPGRTRKRRDPVRAEDVLADRSFDEKKAWLSLLKATTISTVVGEGGKRRTGFLFSVIIVWGVRVLICVSF